MFSSLQYKYHYTVLQCIMVPRARALPVLGVAFNISECKILYYSTLTYKAMAANVHSKCHKAL